MKSKEIAARKFVLGKRPEAKCSGYAGKSFISFHINDGPELLGIGDTVRGAWRDAAAHLRRPSTTTASKGK